MLAPIVPKPKHLIAFYAKAHNLTINFPQWPSPFFWSPPYDSLISSHVHG